MLDFLIKKHHRTLYFFKIILFILINNCYSYIILPFKSTNIEINLNNSINQIEDILSEINKNQLYSFISFGNPQQNLEIYYTMEKSFYAILSNFCKKGTYTTYNPFFSQNYRNKTITFPISFDLVNNGIVGYDNCSFFNDLNLTNSKIINSFEFILGNNSSPEFKNLEPDKYCGMLGLAQDPNEHFLFAKNFICYLKQEKIIDSYAWGLFFFDKEKSYNIDYNIQNKYDGFYIAGITDNDYSNIFNTNNITNDYSKKTNNYITFDKIFFYENCSKKKNECFVSNNISVELVIDNNYIISDIEYYNKIKKSFFQKYLDDNICIEKNSDKTIGGKNYMIICDSNFKNNLKNFPNLYFYNRELSFTFNLDYNDVFFIYNTKIYFLIIGNELYTTWKLGKMFMHKYPFIFDQDKKKIYFVHLNKYDEQTYNNENTEKQNNIWKNVILFSLISLLFIGIIIGIFIGKKIWKTNRKIRANELKDEEDNYEYISKEDQYSKINE